MMIKYLEHTIEVPDSLIKMYLQDFATFRDPEMRIDLDMLRNAIYQLMILAKKNPKILYKDIYRKDLADAFAVREALFRLKLLHDA